MYENMNEGKRPTEITSPISNVNHLVQYIYPPRNYQTQISVILGS